MNLASAALLTLLAACSTHHNTPVTQLPGAANGANGSNFLPPAPVQPEGQTDQGSPYLVQITQVNGQSVDNQGREISVRPGDIISLVANIIDRNTGVTIQDGTRPQDFTWKSNFNGGNDVCDLGHGGNCFTPSNFQANGEGVSFSVPYNLSTPQLSITVTSPHNRYAIGSSDTIVLNNEMPNYVPPTAPITSFSDYHYAQFDPTLALAGMGRWIYVDGLRFWSPYTYTFEEQIEWVPYQNGYWTWVGGEYTWVSYDPWGWMTDHYGVWRHHQNYGWIWVPSPNLEYRPCVVTWFYTDTHVGWYPYYEGFNYTQSGFNDGFWLNTELRTNYQSYHAGFTIIEQRNFTNVNISTVVVNRTFLYRASNQSTLNLGGTAQFGVPPRPMLEYRMGRAIPETRVETRVVGNRSVSAPVIVHPLPEHYRAIVQTSLVQKPAALGTTIQVSRVSPQSAPRIIPPVSAVPTVPIPRGNLPKRKPGYHPNMIVDSE